MKRYAAQAFDHIFPAADELWQRAGAEMVPTVVDEGHVEDVPFFDLEVTRLEVLKDEPFVTRSGRELGRTILHRIDVNGIDHLARAFVPNDEYRTDSDFTITGGTAWLTTINGYAEDRSNKIFADTQLPLLQMGPPHSATVLPKPLEWLRVPKTVLQARETSLARTAQIEQLAFAALSSADMYDLPTSQVPIGDSRGSNTIPARFVYAPHYGSEIVAFDGMARCAAEKMSADNLPEFAGWLAQTGLGGIAVAVCLAKENQLGSLRGTSSLNPNFLASNFTGTMRALASGETLRTINWIPRDAHGIDVLYGRDSMAHLDLIEEAWENHPNVVTKRVPQGTHAALLHPLAHRGRRNRMKKLADQYRQAGGNTQSIDWDFVYGRTVDEPLLDKLAS